MLRYPTNSNAFDARGVIGHSPYTDLSIYSPRKDIAVSFRPIDVDDLLKASHDFSVTETITPIVSLHSSLPPVSVITQRQGRLNRQERDFVSVLVNDAICKLEEPNDDSNFVGDMIFKLSPKESIISTVKVISKEKYVPVLDDDDYWDE